MPDSSSGGPPGGGGGSAPAPPPPGLARPALRGSAWTLAGYAASQVLRLGSNLILTRLLFPAVFGQMALIQIFIQGLVMFSDIGTGPAIVQSPRGDDPVFLRTLWTIQCARGFVLWLCTWAIAAPVASFYEQPLLVWLVPAAGLASVMQGFESTSLHTLQRHLKLGRLTVVEFAAQAIGVAGLILLVLAHRAWAGPDAPGAVWAMVAGSLVGSAARLVLSHLALPGIRHRFALDADSMRHQLGFGRWVFVSTALTFLAGQLDRLIFGKVMTIDLLGIYGIAAMMAALPSQAVLKLGSAVIFPAFSRVAARSDFPRVFWRVRLPFLLGGAVLVSGLVASGPYLIRILYDPRYAQAGWILQYLAVVAWFQILGATNEAALLAMGSPDWLAAGSAAKVAGLVVLVPLGFRLDGFRGALAGLVLAEVAKYLTSAVAAARRGLRGIGRDLAATAMIALVSALGLMAGDAVATGRHPDLAGFLCAGTLVVALWGLLALAGWRRGLLGAGWAADRP